MGGGCIIRTMARAIGATAAASSPDSTSVTSNLCSCCKNLRTRPTTLRTSASLCTSSSSRSQEGSISAYKCSDLEDWEFAGRDEHLHAEPQSRVIFGTVTVQDEEVEKSVDGSYGNIFVGVPTPDEADAATSDLENVLRMELFPTSKTHLDGASPSMPASPMQSYLTDFVGIDTTLEHQAAYDWVEPHITVLEPRATQVGISRVYDAFQLLQNDATVKGAVISIVSDQGVWDAIMKNEKVQELMQDSEDTQNIDDKEGTQNTHSNFDKPTNSFDIISALFGYTKLAVTHLKEKFAKIINIILTLADMSFTPKKQDGLDERLKSCLMLSVVVLIIVLVRRANS